MYSVQVQLSKMAFELNIKYTVASLWNVAVFARRTQQIMTAGVVAMNLVRVPKLRM